MQYTHQFRVTRLICDSSFVYVSATICSVPFQRNRINYYTSEEFFLYKITVDKRTIHHFSRQNELLTGT